MGAQRLSHVFDFERRDELIKERRDAVRQFVLLHVGERACSNLHSATPYEVRAICAEETM